MLNLIGMINGGIGKTHVNGLLAAFNSSKIYVTQKSLQSIEREIASHLNDSVEQSCSKHLDKPIQCFPLYIVIQCCP